jgi:hypothetical protein
MTCSGASTTEWFPDAGLAHLQRAARGGGIHRRGCAQVWRPVQLQGSRRSLRRRLPFAQRVGGVDPRGSVCAARQVCRDAYRHSGGGAADRPDCARALRGLEGLSAAGLTGPTGRRVAGRRQDGGVGRSVGGGSGAEQFPAQPCASGLWAVPRGRLATVRVRPTAEAAPSGLTASPTSRYKRRCLRVAHVGRLKREAGGNPARSRHCERAALLVGALRVFGSRHCARRRAREGGRPWSTQRTVRCPSP